MIFKPADLVFTRGPGWISRAIRWRSRSRGEDPTIVNHVGVVVESGTLSTAMVVEALMPRTVRRTLVTGYSGRETQVEIYRPLNLTQRDIEIVRSTAEGYVNRKYGWGKIVLHALGLQGLAGVDKWPICSWISARAYWEAGYTFGVKPATATPDDQHDFCRSRPDRYECVRELAPVP